MIGLGGKMATPLYASASAPNREPALRVQDLSKNFGSIQAVDSVSFELYEGEIVGIVGDNGAGKSTLVKLLAGAEQPSSGAISLGGQPVRFRSPAHARDAGVEVVYQNLALSSILGVAGNVYLGREIVAGGWLAPFGILRKRAMGQQATRALSNLRVSIPEGEHRPVQAMSGGQRQAVAITRAAFWNPRLLLLDEPTAALGVKESAEVVRLIDGLAQNGTPVVLVSHNLEHVTSLCHRIIVLRQGRHAATLSREASYEQIVSYITGARR